MSLWPKVVEAASWALSHADKVILGALFTSSCLKAIDKIVERIGERHPSSRFWPWADHQLDRADVVFGWVGDTFKSIVFTRKGL